MLNPAHLLKDIMLNPAHLLEGVKGGGGGGGGGGEQYRKHTCNYTPAFKKWGGYTGLHLSVIQSVRHSVIP